jgi:hypothetical protein
MLNAANPPEARSSRLVSSTRARSVDGPPGDAAAKVGGAQALEVKVGTGQDSAVASKERADSGPLT